MNIIVTGGCGFVGGHLCKYLKDIGHTVTIVDCLTYAADPEAANGFEFVKALCQSLNPSKLLKNGYDAIVHLAAQSHVDNSIEAPRLFFEANVLGTINMLEVARFLKIKTFIQFSTDECTGSLKFGEPRATEYSPMKPSSPYAASKASAELAALSYYRTYGLDVRVIRSTNLYGSRQHVEKMIPRAITYCLTGRPIKIFGTGDNVRSWLNVGDILDGVELVLRKGEPGQTYSFGGEEYANIRVAEAIIEKLGGSIECGKDRQGHDKRYAVDTSRAEDLGWKRECSLIDDLSGLIAWYKNNRKWWEASISRGGLW